MCDEDEVHGDHPEVDRLQALRDLASRPPVPETSTQRGPHAKFVILDEINDFTAGGTC